MKHRIFRKITGLLLAAVLITGTLAGCSGKGDETKGGGNSGGAETEAGEKDSGGQDRAMGRYLEEDVPQPEDGLGGINDVKRLEDGSLRILGSDGNGVKKVWDSGDSGESWQEVYELPKELQEADDGYMDYASIAPDGTLACVYNHISEGGITPALYLVDSAGALKELAFQLPAAEGLEGSGIVYKEDEEGEKPEEGESPAAEEDNMQVSNMILDLQFLGNDQLLIQDMQDKIYQVSTADGSVDRTYDESAVEMNEFYTAGKLLVIQTASELLLFDTENGQQQEVEETLKNGLAEMGSITALDTLDDGESIYCLTGKGLYHYKFGGSLVEQLIDGSLNSLGSPSLYPSVLLMLDEQKLLVSGYDSASANVSGIALLKYSYSADTPAKPSKEVKVYSLYDNREIRQMITHFQKENLDVYVNFEAALSEDNGITTSDALKTLTTEIMAGKGPDVLILDGLPIESYMEKGLLKDLSGVLEDAEGTYFENILNAYRDKEGKLCAVPARFSIPMLQADSEYYQPGEDFAAFTARAGVLEKNIPREVVQKFWYSCGAAWQKEDGTLDQSKITEFLTGLKNAYGAYDSQVEDDSKGEAETSMTVAGMGIREKSRIQEVDIGYNDLELASGKIKANPGLYAGSDYGMLLAVNKELQNGDFGLMPGQAEHVFVPGMTAGISTKGNHQEEAEKFVTYLFTRKAQEMSQGGGLPVEKEAFRSCIDGHEYQSQGISGLVGVAGADDGYTLGYELKPHTEEEVKKLTDLAESLTTPALQDEVIQEAVAEQGEKVLKGELTPEEGAAAIIQKVNIYLAE